MSEPIDGGPAFPDPCGAHPGAMPPDCDKGMTLRDYFAAKAMQGLLASEPCEMRMATPDQSFTELIGRYAYGFADAMLEARKP